MQADLAALGAPDPATSAMASKRSSMHSLFYDDEGGTRQHLEVIDLTEANKNPKTFNKMDLNKEYAFCLDGEVTIAKLMEQEDFGGTVVAWRKAGWGGTTVIVRNGPPAFGKYRVMGAKAHGFPYDKEEAEDLSTSKLAKTAVVLFKGIIAIAFKDADNLGPEAIKPGVPRMPITYIKAQWRTKDGRYITSWETRTDFKALKRGGCSNEWIYRHCSEAEKRVHNQRHRLAQAFVNRTMKVEELGEEEAQKRFTDIPEFGQPYRGVREDGDGDTGMGGIPERPSTAIPISDDEDGKRTPRRGAGSSRNLRALQK